MSTNVPNLKQIGGGHRKNGQKFVDLMWNDPEGTSMRLRPRECSSKMIPLEYILSGSPQIIRVLNQLYTTFV